MHTPGKTPVNVIQELISLQSARLEKQSQASGPAEARTKEADPIIQRLTDELAQHGDAVGASVDRSGPYFQNEHHDEGLFQQTIDRILSESGELPDSLQSIIRTMKKEK